MIEISINTQILKVYKNFEVVKTYKISSASKGIGNEQDSGLTPLGKHCICEKIGEGAPIGTIFKERVNTGIISCLYKDQADYPFEEEAPCITTRILRLQGLQEGINKGEGIDSLSRCIYIHGTPYEYGIGQPNSRGCIRMINEDIVDLFSIVEEGEEVLIYKSTKEKTTKEGREIVYCIEKYLDLEKRGSLAWQESIDVLSRLIELEDDKAMYYYERAVIYNYLEEKDKALKDYDKTLELDPNHVDARGNRASIYADKQDWDNAVADCEKCVEIDPNCLVSLNLETFINFRDKIKN